MVALVFMIIAIIGVLGLASYSIYKCVKLVKSPTPRANNYPLEVKKLAYFNITTAFLMLLTFVMLSIFQAYPLKGGEWAALVIGSLLFGFAFPSAICAFIIHYYGKEVPIKLNKGLFWTIIGGLLVSGLGLLIITNSIADYVTYPLVNGISFQKGFTRPGGVKPSIAWYALCILGGAILVYFICDHRFYVEYGKHGILESTFLVAFPAGIIGARIGYVIGNWNRTAEGLSFAQRVANGEWWSPLAIWEGGLTIITGALVGIIVGVLWFIWRNKKYSIWLAVDIIVPTILIAQAIGRWGNFFNAEVHGYEVAAENWRWFLPKMVFNNATFSDKLGFAQPGNIFVPLFYIEFLSNLAGYFFIRFALGKGLKKYLQLGDLAFSYIVWYGLTRVIMEPLRIPSYNMGSNNNFYSWIWAMVFVAAGCFAIFGNHLVRYLINRKKETFKNQSVLASSITSFILLAVSIIFIVLASIYMGGVRTDTMTFDEHNIGLLLLIIGLGVLFIFGCAVIYLIQGLSKKHETV